MDSLKLTDRKISFKSSNTENLEELENVERNPLDLFKDIEWDTLVILDACRFDTYRDISGKEQSRISKASNTPQFIEENFADSNHRDTVYIAGNSSFFWNHPHLDSLPVKNMKRSSLIST